MFRFLSPISVFLFTKFSESFHFVSRVSVIYKFRWDQITPSIIKINNQQRDSCDWFRCSPRKWGKKSRSEFHCLLCLLLRIILIVSNSKPPTSTLCLTGQEFVNYGFGKRCIWRCFVWIHLSLLFRICNVRRGFPSITLVFGLIQFQYLLKFCHYFYFTLFFGRSRCTRSVCRASLSLTIRV